MTIKKKIEEIVSLKKIGKILESEKLLKIALDNESYNYDNLINFALLLIKNKYYEDSIQFLLKAIKNNPSKSDAYINLSNIYIILKNYSKGLELLNIAYEKDSLNIDLIHNIAYLNYELNNSVESSLIIEKGLKLNKKNYFLLNLKGKIFFDKNLIQKSIDLFMESIEIKNDYWNTYENLFFALESTNNIVKFKEYINKAKNIFHQNYFLNLFEAQSLFRENKFEETINFLEDKKLQNRLYNYKKYLILYYDLIAKCYEKIKNYKLSYHCFNLRNELRKNQIENKKFDKQIILNLINNYKKYFIKKNIKNYKKVSSKEQDVISPIFLIGFPRSGTTLLDTILRSHSNTDVLEEKPFISTIRDNFFESNNNLINSIEKLNFKKIKLIQREYLDLLNLDNKFSSTDKIIIDKFPLNIIEIGFIKRIFPNSKFILSIRHPCDVIFSCFASNFKINEGMANFYDLESAAVLYNEVFLLFEHYIKIFDINYYLIKYENIVNDFDSTIKNLLNFLELKWEDDLIDFNNTAINRNKINTPSYSQVIQPLYNSSINRWKNYDQMNDVYPIIDKWIKKFNY